MGHNFLRSHCLRLWTSAAVVLAPAASVIAQQQAASRLELQFVTPESFAFVAARPRQVLTAQEMQMLPYEVIQAAGQQELGIDPLQVEEIQVIVEPPALGPPQFLAVVRFAEAFALGQLDEKLTQHTERDRLDGRPYLKSSSFEPSLFAPDEKTLLVGSDEMLRRAYAGRNNAQTSSLIERLQRTHGAADIIGAVEIGPLRPLINAQLGQIPPLPPALEAFKKAPNLLDATEFSLSLTGSQGFSLVWYAADEQAARELEQLVQQGLEMWQQQMLAAFEQAPQSDDVIEQAMGRYMQRVSGQMTEIYRPTRDGNRLIFFGGERDEQTEKLYTVATIGILVALLLPAVQAAREAARRNVCRNNLRQLGIAMHNYHDVHKRFPAQANFDRNGKPLLSWRVHILPFIEEQALYQQFHLDEPWDSEHNKTLIPLMPQIFADPSSANAAARHLSSYVAPVGEGLFMEGQEGFRLTEIRDGTSATIMLVEVDDEHAPVWTRPQDIEVARTNPAAHLGGHHPGIFMVLFADDHVQEVAGDVDADVLWPIFTRAAGERVDFDRLRR